MKNAISPNHKCSALLALGAGTAVCLTGGGAQAAIHTGTDFGAAGKTFVSGESMYLFSGANRGKVWCWNFGGGRLGLSFSSNQVLFARNGLYIQPLAASVTLPGAYSFIDLLKMPSNISDKYFGVRFGIGSYKYGWVHVQSSASDGSSFKVTKWGYNDQVGGTIKTLAESITARKLGLSDGRVKLHWTSANEDGVARYEVQAQDASGAWKAISTDTPGAGSYSANVSKDSTCRLIVEMVDGQTHEVTF